MKKLTNIRWRSLIVLAALVVTLGYGGTRALAADAFKVSGTISNQNGSGVQNVAVTATTPGTATVVAGPVASGADGSYEFFVEQGTYDLHFLPPASSGLSELIQSNVVVDADRTVGVQLAPATEQHRFSGVLTDSHGNPLPGIQVRLNSSFVMAANANGEFSGTVAAGTYDVSIRKDSLDAPEYPYFWLPYGTVDLTSADVVRNFQLPPVLKLSVTTLNSDGVPVSNQAVSLQNDPLLESDGGRSNALGVAELRMIEGIAIPEGSVCTTFNPGNARVCNTEPISATQNTNITLQAPDLNLHTITGTVTDADGVGVAGLDVKFINGPNPGGGKTDASGNYTFTTIVGTYDVLVTKDDSGIAKKFPYFTLGMGQVDATTNVTKNIQLPAVRNLTVTFNQPDGTPVAAPIGYSVGDRFQPGNAAWQANSGSAGQAVLPVLDGLTLPAGAVCAYAYGDTICNTASIPVTQDVNLALVAPVTHTFSGKLLDANGVAMRNIRVELNGYGVVTSKTGDFSVTLKAGTYDLVFRNDTTQPGLPYFRLPFGTVDLTTADVTSNYNLPRLFSLGVTVKDKDGNPAVQSVSISTPAHFNGALTNSAGFVSLPVFEGKTIEAGELCTIFQNGSAICNATALPVTGNLTFLFQQSADPVKPPAPANVVGNLVNGQPIITWDAVTEADHYVIYRDGAVLGVVNATEYTDATAEPGEHVYYVVAVNSSGVSSDPSESVTVTVAAADTTPPTVGDFTLPAKSVDQSVQFNVPATDDGSGVAGGEFFYGTDPGVGNANSMTYANGNLTGTLGNTLPAGVYKVWARAQDNAGNWSEVKSADLVVTAPVSQARGQQISFRPTAGTDVLPNMGSATIFNSAQANFNVNYSGSGVASGSNFTFTYNTGGFWCSFLPFLGGCHTFTVTMTNVASFQLYGQNYSQARIVGTANVTIDGVTTSRPFAAEVVDGNRVNSSTQDSYELKIYEAGANPETATAEYHVTRTIGRGGVTIQ